MRRTVKWVLAGLVYALFAIAAAAQPVCDINDRAVHPRLTQSEFFQRTNGAIALGATCNYGSNLCQSYIDISNCSEVIFPLAESGDAGKVFFAINTMSECEGDCDLVDSFLVAGLLFENAEATAPFADMRRNATRRWGPYLGSLKAQSGCCDTLLKPDIFLQHHAATSDPSNLIKLTGERWHSVFGSQFNENVLTWDYRDFFTAALSDCGDCSIKTWLLRFEETQSARRQKPTTPLMFSARVMSYPAARLVAMVPNGGDAYWKDLLVRFAR